MALFDVFKKHKEKERFDKKAKDKVEKTETVETKKEEKIKASTKASNFAIGAPHITEKATFLQGKNAYVFKIDKSANTAVVKEEIKKAYGITPTKVNIINIPSKNVFVRGRRGAKSGFKKAVVYLKKGDKIEVA